MDKWWVWGLNIGYEHSFINQFADFVVDLWITKSVLYDPTSAMLWKPKYICEAVLDSAKTGRWKKVGKIRSKASKLPQIFYLVKGVRLGSDSFF